MTNLDKFLVLLCAATIGLASFAMGYMIGGKSADPCRCSGSYDLQIAPPQPYDPLPPLPSGSTGVIGDAK